MRNNKIMVYILTAVLLILALAVPICLAETDEIIPFYVTVSSGEEDEQINCWKSEENECYVFLPSYADIAQAQIYLNTDNLVSIDGTILTDGMYCGGFELDVPYVLTYSVFGKSYKYDITFVQSGGIATMYIDTESGNMDYIHNKKGNEEKGMLTLHNPDGSIDYAGNLESIKGRGNNTWEGFDKKPYSLELSSEADLLGMGEAQKWILLANADDSSNLRNKIVYDFAEDIGLAYSPNSQWVDLYLNGEYAGLYLLCERNEVHTQRIDISKDNSFLFSLEPKERLISQNYTYILTKGEHALRVHYPANISGELLDSASQIWQYAENAIFSDDGIDPITEKSWQELIDLDSWVKKYLIEEIFGNLDGGLASQYFYIDGNVDTSKIYAGPVWDYDKTLGNDSDVKYAVTNPKAFVVSRFWYEDNTNPQWFESLYQKEAFQNRMTELFAKEFIPQIKKLLESEIDSYVKEIELASQMNAIRWFGDNTSLDTEVDKITSYLKGHIEFLSNVWIDDIEYCKVNIFSLENEWFYSVPVGENLQELPVIEDTNDAVFGGWYYVDTDEPFDIIQPIYEDTEIYAKWQNTSNEKIKDILKLSPIAVIAMLFVAIAVTDIKRNRVAKK